MSRYMMPVEVNSRKFISLHFSDDDQETVNKEQRFVCEIPEMGELNLLAFLVEGQASSDRCTNLDKQVSLYSIEQPDKDVDDYVLHFYSNDEHEKVEPENKSNEHISVNKIEGRYHLTFNYQHESKSVSMLCKLHIGDKVWSSILTFELILRVNMFQTALDFGSEASQGILKSSDGDGTPLNFIDLAKTHLYSQYKNNKNNEFHQYQEDNENNSCLFRSLFYLKDRRPLFLSLQADDNLLQRDCRQLPNIKIGLLNNRVPDIISYYSNIVLDFIRTVCHYIVGLRNIDSQTSTFGLQLELLVPNVMSMIQISKMVTAVQTKFDSYLDDPVLGNFRLEINTFSESDASFLGYFRNQARFDNRLVADKPYLIIDGGNGTMDFSIISISNIVEYKSFYRDGFVGSGNAITYALFDHICAVIVGFMNNDGRKKLMQSLLFGAQTDQLGLRNLRNELEKIKKADKNVLTAERNCKLLKEKFGNEWQKMNLGALTSFLSENKGDYGDCFGIIHATCDKICRLLTNNLLRNRIKSNCMPHEMDGNWTPAARFDEVILAGRAFRYPMLRETLQAYMQKYFGITKDKIQFHSKSAKVSCLYGLFQFKMVNGNCGLSGIPSVGIVLDKNDGNSNSQDGRTGGVWFDNILDKWLSSANQQAGRLTPVESFEVNEDFLNKGCDIQIKSNEVLFLNGREIQTAIPLINKSAAGNNKFNLYYNGTELLLRTNNNVSQLTRVAAKIPIESSLIYESRFPNYDSQQVSSDMADLRYFNFPEIINPQ